MSEGGGTQSAGTQSAGSQKSVSRSSKVHPEPEAATDSKETMTHNHTADPGGEGGQAQAGGAAGEGAVGNQTDTRATEDEV